MIPPRVILPRRGSKSARGVFGQALKYSVGDLDGIFHGTFREIFCREDHPEYSLKYFRDWLAVQEQENRTGGTCEYTSVPPSTWNRVASECECTETASVVTISPP